MFRLFCAYLLLCSASIGPAFSQILAADSTYVLPGITVEDLRSPLSGNDTAAHTTRLSSDMLQRSGVRTVAEALSRHGAIFVRRYGTNGAAGVTLRGTGPSQTAVLLDGLPLENPQLGQVDLSLLPASMLSGVDVMHGGASSLVGSSAVGGVISLRSLAPYDRTGLRVSTGLGAWGERDAAGRLTVSRGRLRGLLTGEVRRVDGDFPYVDRTALSPAAKTRENSDGANANLMTRLVLIGDNSTVEVAGWFMNAERGLPGLSGSGATSERQEDQIRRAWMSYRFGETTFTAGTQRSSLRYTNPELGVDDTGRTTSTSLRFSRSQEVIRNVKSDVGIDASIQTATHPSLRDAVRQRRVRAFASGAISVRSVTLLPTLHGEWTFRTGGSGGRISPGMRLRYDSLIRGLITLKGGLSTSFRMPTFNDLYWRGQGAVGNSRLSAEKGRTVDAGFLLTSRLANVEATAFYQTVQDQITWLPDDAGIWTPENIESVRNMGVESTVSQSIAVADNASMDVAAHHTLTYSRNRTDDTSSSNHPLRYVPRHVLNIDASFTWTFLRFGLSGRYVGRRYLTTDASEWVAAYTVLSGDLSGRFLTGFGSVNMGIYVENIGGVDYQMMYGYPMPPRSVRLQLSLTIQ
ncbi:MAG: TonB-dependent receptor [Rhodothermales bacterium]|nr:TonB-dependent receptor [Rhodothermales bacterium]